MKILSLILLVASLPAHARWLKVEEAGSVLEKFHLDYDIYKNGSFTQTNEYVIRVQSEDAKANSSLFPIEYNAFTDQVEVLDAYTENGNEKIKVDPSAIEDRDKGESKDYDVQKVRSVVFPQVQIGSRLHLKYRVKTTKPLIEDRWSTEISLAPGFHTEKFSATITSEMPLFFVLKDKRDLLTVKQPKPTRIEVKNKRTLPGFVHAEKDPVFHPENNTELLLSSSKDWPFFFSKIGKDYEDIIQQPLPKDLKAWTDQAAKKKTAPEQINFLLEKVSKNFRYFGDWRRHNGGFVPRPLADISSSRYGDCKDLATLLTAMLRQLKMDAKVALVRRGGNPWGVEPDYPLPGVNFFNHAIVHVQNGTEEYWLDATNPVMSLKPYPDISGRPAWLMGEKGTMARLPPALSSEFVHIHEYEYRFTDDDNVAVRVKAQLNKLAPYSLANDLLLSPRSDVLSETLEYFSEGQEIKSHKYIVEPNTDRLLKDMKVDLEYVSGRVTFTAGKQAFWVIPDGFLQGAFYETEDRESDMQLSSEPYLFKGVRRLKDTKLVQETPPTCAISSEWMDFERKIEAQGSDVVITQSVDLKKPFITHDEYRSAPFKKLQADTKRCFYRSGVLIEPAKRTLSSTAG